MSSESDMSIPGPGPTPLECPVADNPQWIADGWVRRHIADPRRAAESIELYTSLGFEVRTHKLAPADFGPACAECAAVACRSYVMIYTRKTGETPQTDSSRRPSPDAREQPS
ncbi:MAG: hypothetical protein ACE5HE_04710 [Phycisphaerae bacterium]